MGDVLALAEWNGCSFPSCWTMPQNDVTYSVDVQAGNEYKVVTGYFLKTIARSNVRILELSRLQNQVLWKRFAHHAGHYRDQTVMLHGCRSQANEDAIRKDGFQVSCCRSGGANYGTWFAYQASYSDGGYVYIDAAGVRHIFVCLVAKQSVVRDDATMRVVGQDCAYPFWLLRYTHEGVLASPVYSPAPVYNRAVVPASVVPYMPEPVPFGERPPKFFFEVRNGHWTKVVVKDDAMRPCIRQESDESTCWKFQTSRGRVKVWVRRCLNGE